MKKRNAYEEFMAMTPEERSEAVAEFDKPFIADTFKPLTPAQRARWEKAKRKPGRPRIGKGAQRVLVTLEKTLLRDADRTAKAMRVSRSRLVALGLRAIIGRKPKKAA